MVKKVTVWSAIGSVWTAWWAFVMIWITVYDLPPGSTYWSWCIDTTGYWHEMALPLMSWLSGLAILMVVSLWYHAIRFLESMSKVIIVPDGQPVRIIVRKRVHAPNGNLQDKQTPVPHSAPFVESDDPSRLRQWYGPH